MMNKIEIKTAVILAAGKGTRLDGLTKGLFPKPLTTIEDVPIIEYSIRALKANGVERVLIGCGFMLEKFRYLETKYGVEIVENPKFDKLGSLSTLMIFEGVVSEEFYLLEADIIYDPVVLKCLASGDLTKNFISTSNAVELDDNIFVNTIDETLVSVRRQVVDNYVGKPEVMTGIWAFSKDFMQRFGKFCIEENIDLDNDYEIALAKYSAKTEPIKTKYYDELNWCEIDNEDHYQYAAEKVWPKIKDSY